jgi:CRP-like cAMP-binding protein
LVFKVFSKGQMLFSKGDTADYAYVVLHGNVSLYNMDLTKARAKLTYLKPPMHESATEQTVSEDDAL